MEEPKLSRLTYTVIALLASMVIAIAYALIFGEPVPVVVELPEESVVVQPQISVEQPAADPGLAFDSSNTTHFTNLSTTDLTVTDDSTLTDDVDIGGTLNFGSNDLYPLGYGSDGQQAVYGTSSITGTAEAAHGLTTVTFALCTLAQDPDDDAGDAAHCTVTVSSNTVTVKAWQDDFVTEATETDVDVNWLVIGAP